jgi:L,D-transpeptidase ErfK/SrfK
MAAAPPAFGAEYALKAGERIVGVIGSHTTQPNDTLLDVARNHDLGFTQLMAANQGESPWLPGADRRITLPSSYILPDGPLEGLVINLASQRLFYFPKGGSRVLSYPIGVGAEGFNTPLGMTTIVRKRANPVWYPPASLRAQNPNLPSAVPPGPNNPLGDFALYLGWPRHLVHGTNKPYGVGRAVSHGCIRLYPEDIAHLFPMVPIGTPVRVTLQETAVAWMGDRLFLQVFPTKAQSIQLETTYRLIPEEPANLSSLILAKVGERQVVIDWDRVKNAGRERTGLIIEIGRVLPAGTSRASDDHGCGESLCM